MSEGSECLHCGRVPTADVELRAQAGMVVAARRSVLRGPLCKQCGLALFRERMNRTLLLGWWGVLAFFLNFHAIAKNLIAWQRLRALHDPWGAPRRPPLEPGAPVPARPGMAVVVGFFVLGWFLVDSAGDKVPPDLSGRCVNLVTDGVETVDCAEIHDGLVVRMAAMSSECPAGSDDAVKLSRPENPIACVDLDR